MERIIAETLQSLPKKTRQIFVLNRFEGLSYNEIAEKMNLSNKTIEYHISKALGKLRISLKDFYISYAFLISFLLKYILRLGLFFSELLFIYTGKKIYSMNREFLYRFFEGKTSIDEEKSIRSWLTESEENKKIFLEERMSYDALLLTSHNVVNKQKRIYRIHSLDDKYSGSSRFTTHCRRFIFIQ